jgi:hypothetical protein
MKKIIFTFLSFCLIYSQSNAQACYTSGPGVCDTVTTLAAPGLIPVPELLAPVINGTSCTVTIQFQNYDTLTFDNTNIHVQSLTVDSIGGLPGHACWATNKTDNTYTTNENGCIAVTFDSLAALPGQYQLAIYVTAVTQELGTIGAEPNPLSAAAAGLYYYVRVINNGMIIPALDTTGQAKGTSPAFQGYNFPIVGGSGLTCDSTVLDSTYLNYTDTLFTGIQSVNSDIHRLSVSPNPFSQSAIVTFSSEVAEPMTEKLTDILGRTIWTREMQVLIGANQSKIDRAALPSGIYFYSVGKGESLTSQKLIITE